MKEEKGARLYLMVCTQLLLLWLNLQASSCHHLYTGTINDQRLPCPLLTFRGRCPPRYGNNGAHQPMHVVTARALDIVNDAALHGDMPMM
jgi:hypothetical protein